MCHNIKKTTITDSPSRHSSISVSQLTPVYPMLQEQTYPPGTSIWRLHSPPFSQGEGLQADSLQRAELLVLVVMVTTPVMVDMAL